MKLIRTTTFLAKDEFANQLSAFLTKLSEYIRNSEGNISREVFTDKDNKNSFLVIEEWDKEESHKNSVDSFPKDMMNDVFVYFAAPPKGNFFIR